MYFLEVKQKESYCSDPLTFNIKDKNEMIDILCLMLKYGCFVTATMKADEEETGEDSCSQSREAGGEPMIIVKPQNRATEGGPMASAKPKRNVLEMESSFSFSIDEDVPEEVKALAE